MMHINLKIGQTEGKMQIVEDTSQCCLGTCSESLSDAQICLRNDFQSLKCYSPLDICLSTQTESEVNCLEAWLN